MSKLILIITSFFLANSIFAQSIYSYTVTTIEGDTKVLSICQGKKLLIITLPIQQNASNDSLLHSLDSLQSANPNTLRIIATPSYEDGYMPAIKSALQIWYRSILGNEIIITEGLHTRKISGSQQSSLFKWLTDKNKNGHFDEDITGPRNKFMVWTDGELTGLLNPQTRIGGALMNELIQGQ